MSMEEILVVDDEQPVREFLAHLLTMRGYQCTQAADGEEGLRALGERPFALVLCDVKMPGMSGIELLRQIREGHPDIGVVMATGEDDPATARSALELGAYGYVLKPFRVNELLIQVSNALHRQALERERLTYQRDLEDRVAHRTTNLRKSMMRLLEAEKEIRATQEEIIHRLANAAEFRDLETAQHIQRMSSYCALLARLLGMDAGYCERIRLASQMHDVGKIGIPDHILKKPGKLTPEEYEIMKQHTVFGYQILEGSASPLLQLSASVTLTHHERFDGRGYPHGLSGLNIPVEGRVAAVADVFDALTSRRVYKPAMNVEESFSIMEKESGHHFDPEILDRFLRQKEEIREIRRRFSEAGEEQRPPEAHDTPILRA